MVEHLVFQVVSDPRVGESQLYSSPGTVTAVIPGTQSGTIVAGTVASTLLPEASVSQIVMSRLVPAWERILALVPQDE
jgi:hypothetical protein